jgi:hypothetical protein
VQFPRDAADGTYAERTHIHTQEHSGEREQRTQTQKTHLVKDGLEVVAGLGRALEVLDRLDLLGEVVGLIHIDGRLTLAAKLLQCGVIVTQICLGADQNLGHVRAEVHHLWVPLGADVLETDRVHNAEAHQEHIRVRIAKRTQSIVLLLTSCIPQTQFDGLITGCEVNDILREFKRASSRERERNNNKRERNNKKRERKKM